MAKLVEILARELKEWPEGAGNTCSQDPDREARFHNIGFDFYLRDLADDAARGDDYGGGVEVTRSEWQAAVDALNKPAEPAWNGEGRPPIGVEVECSYPMWGYWLKGKVLCYGEQMIFMEQESSKGNGKFEGSMNPDGIMFRPIRTPEQIAAEEQESRISFMLDDYHVITGRTPDCYIREAFRALESAGYRKQVQP